MDKLTVCSVRSIRVSIYEDDNQFREIGPFELTQFNTDFMLGFVPVCTATVCTGATFDRNTASEYIVGELIDKFNHTKLTLSIDIIIDVLNSSGTLKVVPNREPKFINVFNGVITSVTPYTNQSTGGVSSSSVIISAHHRFSELYSWGSNGLIYATPEDVDTNSLSDLVTKMKNSFRVNRDSSVLYSATCIEEVMNECVPSHEGSDVTSIKSIPYTIKCLIDKMVKAKAILPDKELDISSYIDGTLCFGITNSAIRTFTRHYLTGIWDSVSEGNLADAILSVCNNPEYMITVAPRSTEKLTFIQNNGTTKYDVHPVITKDMYTGIRYDTDKDLKVTQNAIIVTSGESMYYSGGTGNIISRYPSYNANDMLRWKVTQAPQWLSDSSKWSGSNTSSSGEPLSENEYKVLCDKYAEGSYNKICCETNKISLSLDLRYIEAFKALGSVCDIYTKEMGDIQGMFNRFSLYIRRTPKGSSVSINAVFSHITRSTDDTTDPRDLNGLYTIENKDVIRIIPDISKDVS